MHHSGSLIGPSDFSTYDMRHMTYDMRYPLLSSIYHSNELLPQNSGLLYFNTYIYTYTVCVYSCKPVYRCYSCISIVYTRLMYSPTAINLIKELYRDSELNNIEHEARGSCAWKEIVKVTSSTRTIYLTD